MDHHNSLSLRAKDAAALLGCGVSTFWRYNNIHPDFPRPFKVSPRLTVWDRQELLTWRESHRVRSKK